MNVNKKMSGFTIIELLVVMAISGIIMSLSGFIYFQIQRIVIANVNNFDNVNQTLFILKKLDTEIRDSEQVLLKKNEILIKDYLGNQISYNICKLFDILSDSTSKYYFTVTNLKYKNEPGTNFIKQITFDLTSNSADTLHILLSKEYSPLVLLNNFKNYSIEH